MTPPRNHGKQIDTLKQLGAPLSIVPNSGKSASLRFPHRSLFALAGSEI